MLGGEEGRLGEGLHLELVPWGAAKDIVVTSMGRFRLPQWVMEDAVGDVTLAQPGCHGGKMAHGHSICPLVVA